MSQAILQFRAPSASPRRAAESRRPSPITRLLQTRPRRAAAGSPIAIRPATTEPQPLVAPNGQLFWAGSDRR